MQRLKYFFRDYRLPVITTGILLIVITGLSVLRAYERSVLAEVLSDNVISGQDYASLLSSDTVASPQSNNVTQDEPAAAADIKPEQASQPAPATQTPLTITNNSPGTGGQVTAPVNNTPAPAPAFGAGIEYFRIDGASTMPCSSVGLPIGIGNGLGGTCKKYVFGAGINTVNGPGTVNYEWRSSVASANESKSFSVGAGKNFTSVQKEIVASCKETGAFTIQLRLTSPTSTSSPVITVQHNC